MVGYLEQGLEKTVKIAFVSGFPDCISMELQRLTGIETMEVEELLKYARVPAKHPNELGAVATSTGDIPGEKEKLLKRQSRRSVVRCFICQGPQLIRDCKELRPDIICFRGGQIGHVSRRRLLLQRKRVKGCYGASSQPFLNGKAPGSLLHIDK